MPNFRTLLLVLLLVSTIGSTAAKIDTHFYHALNAYDQQQFQRAFSYFKKSAELGNKDSQYNLGILYQYGQGTRRNASLANVWLQRAADNGHAGAAYSIGKLIIDKRHKTIKDLTFAVKWFRQAAKLNNAKAMYWLGNMYTMGKGVALDRKIAAIWYQKGAKLGDKNAQLHLGRIYARGVGIPRSLTQAYAWTHVALKQGHPHARTNLIYLQKRLSSSELLTAKILSSRLYQQYVLALKSKY